MTYLVSDKMKTRDAYASKKYSIQDKLFWIHLGYHPIQDNLGYLAAYLGLRKNSCGGSAKP